MPDAVTPDTYLRVQPADTSLSPGAAVRLLERCHDLAIDGLDGLRDHLSSPGPSIIEACLATRGADDGVGFYLGVSHPDIDPGDGAHETLLARFERTCRTAFPRRYDIKPVAWAPTEVLRIDGEGDDHDDLTTAAVKHQTKTSRTRDRQTPLTTYPDLVGDERFGETRSPLATVADALADSPVPAVYQALVRPYRDWSGARADRQHALEHHRGTVIDQVVNAVLVEPAPDDLDLPPDDRARIESASATRAAARTGRSRASERAAHPRAANR
jgi:hypothetical protein